jgi:ribose/xylose/arabinose/galactoside ABC-type transport system permease subunit
MVAIVANLLALWLQQEVVQSVVSTTLSIAPIPSQMLGVFGGFVTAARVMAVVVTLGVCLLFAWIIRGLMSPSVRQEFA